MNSTDFSWLHLSDFHIGKDDYAQRQILGYILEEIDRAIKAGRKPDFVFITGDLADKGKSEEFAKFDELFLIPLLERLGDSSFDKVYIIPGNHDVDRRKARAVQRYGVLDNVQNFLDPTPEGKEERLPILPRFDAFAQHSWLLDTQNWVTSADGYLAREVQIGQSRIGVLCLNSAWFCGGE